MAAIAVADIYECKVGLYYGGQAGINVSHWYCTNVSGAGSNDAALALALDNRFATPYKNVMGGQATYYGVRVQRIKPLPVPIPQISAANTGVGAFGMDCLPSVVAGIINFKTDVVGRANRGRIFVPFPAKTAHDSTTNKPTAAYNAAMVLLEATYASITIGALADTATLVPAIWHRGSLTVTQVAVIGTSEKWASVHKRGNYGKPNAYPPF